MEIFPFLFINDSLQHFGSPTAEEKRAFTRVLQGHIAIDTAVFPNGTTGMIFPLGNGDQSDAHE